MICAIVWGETEELGKFNNSLAMNGTGIVNHDVFLPGAVPGRTYYFQVQGSTADGTLYRTETATFTIPEGETAVADRRADRGDESRDRRNGRRGELGVLRRVRRGERDRRLRNDGMVDRR